MMEKPLFVRRDSFFPTPEEVISGVKWLKENPMVATLAAATAGAISVLSYMKKHQSVTSSMENLPSWNDLLEEFPADEDECEEAHEFCKPHGAECSCPPVRRRVNNSVSASRLADRRSLPNHFHSPVQPRLVKSYSQPVPYNDESMSDLITDGAEGETVSPQWGWYVSTTPEDYPFSSSQVY